MVLIRPNVSENPRFLKFDLDMLIVILIFFSSIDAKKDGEIKERQRSTPVQNCENSFQQYNAAYNSTVVLDKSADGRYGRFRLD